MYFKMPCWNCGKPLRAGDENIGQKARCPYCGAVGEICPPTMPAPLGPPPIGMDMPTEPPQSDIPPTPERREGGQSRGTSVSLPWTALIALGITVVFYGLLILPLKWFGGRLHSALSHNAVVRLFAERGWVPYVIALLSFWAIAMLIAKYRKLRVQRSALLFDALPSEVAEEIRPDNVEAFRSNLLSLPISPEYSFLIGRVLRALDHYRVHPASDEVATLLTTQSDIEANTVETSYTMIKVLVWAIPILGFIGTVMGVGFAVGSFADVIGSADNFGAVKDSLGNVTGGLGIAFDTTLLALVMSLLVMFPASAMQKAEEDLLASVDQYCNENVLRRLGGAVAGAGAAAQQSAVSAQAVEQVMTKHTQDMEAWLTKMGELSRNVTQDVANAWSRIRESFDQVHRQQADTSADAGEQILGAAGRVQAQLAETSTKVGELARMHDRLADVHHQMLEQAQALAGSGDLKQTLTAIDRQLASTADALASLAGGGARGAGGGDGQLARAMESIDRQLGRVADVMTSLEGRLANFEPIEPLQPLDEGAAAEAGWWPPRESGR